MAKVGVQMSNLWNRHRNKKYLAKGFEYSMGEGVDQRESEKS